MSTNKPTPDGTGGFPEVRLKAGYKNPASPNAPADTASSEEPRRNGPLSFDEMLEFTRPGKPQSAPSAGQPSSTSPTMSTPPPPRPMPPVPPPAEWAKPTPATSSTPPSPVSSAPGPAPQSFGSMPTNSDPMVLNVAPPPPPQMAPLSDVRSPAALLASRQHSGERKKQAAMAAAGFVVLVLLVWGISSFFSTPTKVLIKTKPEGVAVYLGEEHLGDTPVEVEIPDLEYMPVLELDGYKTQPVPPIQEPESGEAGKVYVVMEKLPFPLDWSGLPKDTRVWWDGSESKPDTTVAGAHEVKIKPPGQSSFVWSVNTPWKKGESFAIGKAIAAEVKKRPVLKLTLSGAQKADVIVKDGPRFTTTVSLKKGDSSVTLPGPGKYRVMVKATADHSAFEQQVELKEGSKKALAVALWQPVAAPAAAPASSYSGGSGGWSQPSYSQPRSAPRASYSGGGGGGAGRIAPPSF